MIEYFETKVFPDAVKNQSFGKDVKKFIEFVPSNRKGTDQFASDVTFGDVILENEAGQIVKESVVIKTQPRNEVAHRIFHCNGQFSNEVLFYTKVLPLLRKYDTEEVLTKNFAEFVFGKATNGVNPHEDIIVLKNLNSKGYRLTEERAFLDEKHITLALNVLAKYHALSFKCLYEEPEALNEIVLKIQPAYVEDMVDTNNDSPPFDFLALSTSRGIKPLEDDPDYKDRLGDIRKHCEKASFWKTKYWGPAETLNVITHGDFCRNNMMFRYGDNGEPIDVIFFDMATIKFCSPTVDTSFFLMLNTSPEVKRSHWDDFLKTYYDSLSRELDGHPAKLSFDQISLDWRTKSIHGYYLSSFFLPTMLEAPKKWEIENQDFNPEEIAKEMMESGGPRATELISAMVKFMLDKDFIFDQ